MTAAIFGLVGVVIGALITGGTNYALQVRAERREIRAAARLMLQELTNTGSAIRYALELNDRAILHDGSTRTVGPPGSGADTETEVLKDSDPENPANKRGIIRRDMLSMGIGTAASATEVGRRFLEETKLLDSNGRARLVGHVEDDRGVVYPYSRPRAGDLICFPDAADTSYRRIVRTDKSRADRTCSVDLDSPPEGLQATLERLGVVLVPLGL